MRRLSHLPGDLAGRWDIPSTHGKLSRDFPPKPLPTAFAGNRGEGKYRENHRRVVPEEYLKSVSSLSPGQVDEKKFSEENSAM